MAIGELGGGHTSPYQGEACLMTWPSEPLSRSITELVSAPEGRHGVEKNTMQSANTTAQPTRRTGRPAVLLVGADKGGVGKTTVTPVRPGVAGVYFRFTCLAASACWAGRSSE